MSRFPFAVPLAKTGSVLIAIVSIPCFAKAFSSSTKSRRSSGVIPVGKYLNEDALDVALPAGDYPCTACFYAVGEDGAVLGSGAAKVTLHIKT